MIIVTMNDKTGEVKETSIVCPFATHLDPKTTSVKDGEDYVEGTSVTSLEGYEPLESIVARCMRTVTTPNGSVYQVLDKDALKAEETQVGIYEASEAKSLDEAFDTLDPTSVQGFDLSDASRIQNGIGEKLAKAESDETSSNLSTKEASEIPNNEASAVVGKSESKSETDSFPEKRNSNISDKGK